jgi:hypothetical protein
MTLPITHEEKMDLTENVKIRQLEVIAKRRADENEYIEKAFGRQSIFLLRAMVDAETHRREEAEND